MRVVDQNSLGLNVTYIKLEKGYTLAEGTPVCDQWDAVNAVADALQDLDREVVILVTLKTNNVPINASVVSVGTVNASFVCPKEVMKTAVLSNASKIMLFHNHPSGGAIPSVPDIQLTDRLIQCCDLMNIEFLDHIIIGAASREWFSFAEKGMIKPFDIKYKDTMQEIEFTRAEKIPEYAQPVNMAAENTNSYHKQSRSR